MRRSVSLFIFLALCIGFFGVTSQAPARALSNGCATFKGSYTGTQSVYFPFVRGDWLFEPGETLTVTVTSNTPKAVALTGADEFRIYFSELLYSESETTILLSHTFPSATRLTLISYGWSSNNSSLKTLTWYCTPAPFAGPAVPAGYELRTITCDVAVFNAPGGIPIGENRIKAGQTFYVNPKSEKAADGELWSKVFVSGYTDPWIPTKCIGG